MYLRIKKIVASVLCPFIPMKKCAFFSSFEGMYNDNPKPVSELLHKREPNLPIYWVFSSKCRDEMPQYIHKVRYNSFHYWLMVHCAQIVVDNYFGMRLCHGKKSMTREYIRMFFARKRRKQLCISTWHGTPLKKIGMNHYDDRERYSYYTASDLLVAGCEYTKDAFTGACNGTIKIKLYGTPRNDFLFRKDININELKKRLGLPANKKIILFAPTWRPNSVELSGIKQMEMLDFEELLQVLKDKFGGDFCFVYRVHHSIKDRIYTEVLSGKYGDSIIDGNIGDDMAEYLLCTDVLMTDYSGSMFDYALTGRPCFLFTPDIEAYAVNPGFYKGYDWLPFPMADTVQKLLKCIADFDEIQYRKKLETFQDNIGNVEDGHASERIVDDILKFLESGRKDIL